MKKTAVIIGVSGQDGRIACDYLLKKGYAVIGVDKGMFRKKIGQKGYRHARLNIENAEMVSKFLKRVQPDEIYYLAAYHHSSEDQIIENKELFEKSYFVHVLAYLYFLEGIRLYSPRTHIFYAASSLIFGETEEVVQDEMAPYSPDTFYGITKLDGLYLSRFYRKQYGIFASVGILYNHESGYRQKKFLSKKIISTALAIRDGRENRLVLGDLHAKVDWGYAPDYVDAMHKILQLDIADEFIIATGQLHSVAYFAETAFALLGMHWKKYVSEESKTLTRRKKALSGDSSKLRKLTGWYPSVGFDEMIQRLIEECYE